MHLTVKDLFDFEFFIAADQNWWWWWGCFVARDWVWFCRGQFDDGEDWIKSVDGWWEFKAIHSMTDMCFHWVGAESLVTKFGRGSGSRNIYGINPYEVTRI
jgi:hypothetical protein